MTALNMLRAAVLKKSAVATTAVTQPTNAPKQVEQPGQPATYVAGEFHPKVQMAAKTAGVMDWLCKTAGITKTAAKRPGRLDGDEALDKLAKLHSKRKRCS